MSRNSSARQIVQKFLKTSQPGSLGGFSGLAKNLNIRPALAKKALSTSDVYTLNRDSRRRFTRRSFYVTEPGNIFCGDILDVSKWEYQNRRYRYMLVVTDLFTKEVFLEGLKNKSAPVTALAMIKIIKRARIKPGSRYACDNGKEFLGEFKQTLDKYGISIYHTNSLIKISPVERVNREIRRVMRGLFTANKNKNWIDHIDNMESRFNNTISNVTRYAPNDVKQNVDTAFHNIYHKHIVNAVKNRRQTIPVGSVVRVSDRRFNLFVKGPAAWSTEKFVVYAYTPAIPVGYYTLKDKQNHVIDSGFYEQELQVISSV